MYLILTNADDDSKIRVNMNNVVIYSKADIGDGAALEINGGVYLVNETVDQIDNALTFSDNSLRVCANRIY